ncbi:MAG: DUF2442 domain-containing protein [Clostridium sp.]|uniref:DUF2442 domain-containing protein n=1 Tax=Clostridium sp. TaxID=1506 RepID=UPI0029123EB0|nr:DUF2442 domain-containing protein [Clostridium sp.]MDU7150116.1 DUF2442 domain-containing protein [Clostridium sp.]
MKSFNYKVIRVNTLDNYEALVEFDNGENRIVDAIEFINNNIKLQKFKDIDFFKRNIKVINDTMVFDINGDASEYTCYDIAPEYLYFEYPDEKSYELYNKIRHFVPDGDDWSILDDILDEVYDYGYEMNCLGAMFRLFEKYPEEDNDILWGMLHGIENIEGSEERIFWSLRRRKSLFVISMMNRLLNIGVSKINGLNIIEKLKEIMLDENVSVKMRKLAKEFYNYQSNK